MMESDFFKPATESLQPVVSEQEATLKKYESLLKSSGNDVLSAYEEVEKNRQSENPGIIRVLQPGEIITISEDDEVEVIGKMPHVLGWKEDGEIDPVRNTITTLRNHEGQDILKEHGEIKVEGPAVLKVTHRYVDVGKLGDQISWAYSDRIHHGTGMGVAFKEVAHITYVVGEDQLSQMAKEHRAELDHKKALKDREEVELAQARTDLETLKEEVRPEIATLQERRSEIDQEDEQAYKEELLELVKKFKEDCEQAKWQIAALYRGLEESERNRFNMAQGQAQQSPSTMSAEDLLFERRYGTTVHQITLNTLSEQRKYALNTIDDIASRFNPAMYGENKTMRPYVSAYENVMVENLESQLAFYKKRGVDYIESIRELQKKAFMDEIRKAA